MLNSSWSMHFYRLITQAAQGRFIVKMGDQDDRWDRFDSVLPTELSIVSLPAIFFHKTFTKQEDQSLAINSKEVNWQSNATAKEWNENNPLTDQLIDREEIVVESISSGHYIITENNSLELARSFSLVVVKASHFSRLPVFDN